VSIGVGNGVTDQSPDTSAPPPAVNPTTDAGIDDPDAGMDEPEAPVTVVDAGLPPLDAGHDAAPPPPPEYDLSGEIVGLVGSITLDVNGQELMFEQDGTFTLPGWLEGDAYAVTVSTQPDDQACVVDSGEGVFGDENVTVAITCNSDVADLSVLQLGGVDLSSNLELESDFEQSVSVFTQHLSLLAAVLDPSATLSIDGVPTTSGEPLDLQLPLGPRTVELEVQAPSGRIHAYSVEITRRISVGAPETLTAPVPSGAAGFGSGVSLWADSLFVDRDTERNPGGPEGFLFDLDGDGWALNANVEDVVDTPVYRVDQGAVCQDTLAVVVSIADNSALQNLRIASKADGVWSYVTSLGNFALATDVACDGGTIAVRDEAGLDLFERSGDTWSVGPRFSFPADTHPLVRRRLAVSGNMVVLGVPLDNSGSRGIDGDPVASCPNTNCMQGSGAAYVFQRGQSGLWQQTAFIKASNAAPNAFFGISADVKDGVVIVGAYQEASTKTGTVGPAPLYDCATQPSSCASGTGAAYLYEQVDGAWQEVAHVKRSGPQNGENFGAPVALFGDLFVVGTVYSYQFASAAGAATLFHRDADGIAELASFAAPDATTDDNFPRAVALDEHGVLASVFNRQAGNDAVFWFRE
jgi:hypothetical protein